MPTEILPTNIWTDDSKKIILSTIWRSVVRMVEIDVHEENKISLIDAPNDFKHRNEECCIFALDILNNNVLCKVSSIVSPPSVWVYNLHSKTWSCVVKSCLHNTSLEITLATIKFNVLQIEPNGNKQHTGFESIIIHSSNVPENIDSKRPLILYPHGGPHSVFTTAWNPSLIFFHKLGHNVLLVNYRGSIGFGRDALLSLPGKCGSQDVTDCIISLQKAQNLKLCDKSKVVNITLVTLNCILCHKVLLYLYNNDCTLSTYYN